jgi:hypothetical protein
MSAHMPSKAKPPKNSALPRLIIPHRRPLEPFRRYLFAVALYLASGRPTHHVSQRELVLFLNRSSRQPIGRHLHALRVDGFLRRDGHIKKRKLTDADTYFPGRELSKDDVTAWSGLANQLLGRNGLCKGLAGRPAFGTRLLGVTGLLIISTLRKSNIMLTVREIHTFLEFFISSETTIRSVLAKAKLAGLVEQIGTKWRLTPDFDVALERYELDSMARQRRERTRHQYEQERQRFAMALYGHALTPTQAKTLRDSGCIRCGKSNKACKEIHGKQLSIEHFPPKAWLKAWNIPDHIDFAWAICPPENSRYGMRIRKMPIPTLPASVRLDLTSPEEFERVVLAKLQVSVRGFYRALDRRDRKRAGQLAASASSLWLAVVAGAIPLHCQLVGAAGTSKRLHRRKLDTIQHKLRSTGVRHHTTGLTN